VWRVGLAVDKESTETESSAEDARGWDEAKAIRAGGLNPKVRP
jgi:hypothetical protein